MSVFVNLIFLLFCYFVKAHTDENNFSHESPHTIEIWHNRDLTDQRWDAYQDELRWFLEYTDPAKKMAVENTEDYEDQKLYLQEKWSKEHEALAHNIVAMQNAFLDFREKTESALASIYGDGHYAPSMTALVGLETTKWFTEYVEANLFPSNWKELYQQFVEAKAEKTD